MANPVDDARFMALALQLAAKGRYTTAPNPRVGCVLVKDGNIIGTGWHRQAGCAHAEIEALNTVSDARGATAYVTLEPCNHYGKTPPCCDALIRAGVRRVVAAMQDPNPLVSGKGLAKLRNAGIEVAVGVLEPDAQKLNRGFISRIARQRPFVTTKLAMSLDGRTAMASGESQWITSAQARADVHRLRAEHAAILTSVNTVLADNPALTARVDFPTVQPVRVIIDSQLQTPPEAQLGQQPGRTLVLTCSNELTKQQRLIEAGFEVHRLAEKNGHVDLQAAMAFLAAQQINTVWVEAGAILNGALLAENLIDELIVYMAPCLLGDGGRGLFHLPGITALADKILLKLMDMRQVGLDLRITLVPSLYIAKQL